MNVTKADKPTVLAVTDACTNVLDVVIRLTVCWPRENIASRSVPVDLGVGFVDPGVRLVDPGDRFVDPGDRFTGDFFFAISRCTRQ